MPTTEDIRFAKVVLKKGWLPKETLEGALREVEKLRRHDPKIKLPDYLGLKEILQWDKIEWALDVISASQGEARHEAKSRITAAETALGGGRPGAAPVRPRQRVPAGRSHRPAASRRHAGARRAYGGEDHQVFHRRKSNSAPMAVALGVAACVLIVAVGYVFFVKEKGVSISQTTEKGSGVAPAGYEREVPYAEQKAYELVKSVHGTARERMDRARVFLEKYQTSSYVGEVSRLLQQAKNEVDATAQTEWEVFQADFDSYFNHRKYTELIERLRSFAEKFVGTPAGSAAQGKVEWVEMKWSSDSNDKLQAIDLLVTEKRYDEALRECEALMDWCNRGTSSLVGLKIKQIEELRDAVEVAVNPEDTVRPPEKAIDIAKIDPEMGEEITEEPGVEEIPQETPKKEDEEELPEGLFPDPDEEEVFPGDGKEEIDPGSTEAGTSDIEDLFGNDDQGVSAAVKNHPVTLAIKKHGLEKVQKQIERLFVCSQIKVSEDGKVKVAYDFRTRDERLARDWVPTVGRLPSDNVRWSFPAEGGIVRIFYGVRISDRGMFVSTPCFGHEFDVEVYYHSAQRCSRRSCFITGVLDEKEKVWYGTDFGSMAVTASSKGRLKKAKGRREVPEAENIRWFRMTYKGGVIKSYLALAGGKGLGVRVSPVFNKPPNYRPTGELTIKEELTRVRPGVIFHPDIVGTIGYVRITGYLSPQWLAENAKKKGCTMDFEPVNLGGS